MAVHTHLVVEVLHDAGLGGGAVDQDEAEHAVRVGEGQPRQNVGSGALAQADHHPHPQHLQHLDQLLTQLLHRRVLEAAAQRTANVSTAGRHSCTDTACTHTCR